MILDFLFCLISSEKNKNKNKNSKIETNELQSPWENGVCVCVRVEKQPKMPDQYVQFLNLILFIKPNEKRIFIIYFPTSEVRV